MRISELIFGREITDAKRIPLPLMHTGFTRDEALNLDYINSHLNYGKTFGVLAGLTTFGLTVYRKPFKHSLNRNIVAGIIFAGSNAFIVDYLFRYDRTAGNTYDSHLYTNQLFNLNKRLFARNFEEFNRKFLPDEIEQFMFNEKLKTYGRKNFVHNEHVHPPLEEHKIKHKAFNDGVQYMSHEMQKKINIENAEKILDGEKIKIKPFVLSDNCDYTGVNVGAVRLTTLKKMQSHI